MNFKLILSAFILLFYASIQNISAQNNINSSDQIKNLIAKKRTHNKAHGFGFRVQLYNGSEVKARNTRERFKLQFPDTFSKIVYDAPEWKIHVGNYKTRLEADKAMLTFKKDFSGILVISIGK